MAEIQFKTTFYKSNKAADIKMVNPTVIIPDEGHPIQVVRGKELTQVLSKLREFKLPSEKSPFADNKEGNVKQIAWDMKKVLRANVKGATDMQRLDEEAKWVIDVLIPRIMIVEDGPQFVPILDMRRHSMLNLAFNLHDLASRESDEVMSAGKLLSARPAQIFDSQYVLVNHQEEMAVLATAIMQANDREAYPVSLVRPNLSIRDGVAVFPDDETMVTFSIVRTHPETVAMMLMSDHAMLSMLALRSADNIKRKTTTDIHEMIGNGEMEINAFMEAKIELIKERVKLASEYWGDNPLLKSYFEELNQVEEKEPAQVSKDERKVVAVPGPQNTPKDMIRANNITALVDSVEGQIMDAHGVARKVKGFFRDKFTEGMHPDQVVKMIQDVLDKLAAGFEEFGYDSLYMLNACKYVGRVINDQLPGRGLGVEYVAQLNDYFMPVIIKIKESESKK